MASSTFSFLLCVLFFISCANGASHHHGAAAPAPSVDCTTVVMNLADCLSFVTNGSTVTKPEGSCCSGLKTVLKTDAECLCEGFKNSAQFGIVLNVTKALSLPAVCKLHAPPLSNCRLSLSGPSAAAPGLSPSSTPAAGAAGPTLAAKASLQAPSPSPGNAGSRGLSISIGSLAVGILIASLSNSF